MGVSVGSWSPSQLGLKGGTSCFAHLPGLLFHSNRVVRERASLLCPGRVPGSSISVPRGCQTLGPRTGSSRVGLRHGFLLAIKREPRSPSFEDEVEPSRRGDYECQTKLPKFLSVFLLQLILEGLQIKYQASEKANS